MTVEGPPPRPTALADSGAAGKAEEIEDPAAVARRVLRDFVYWRDNCPGVSPWGSLQAGYRLVDAYLESGFLDMLRGEL